MKKLLKKWLGIDKLEEELKVFKDAFGYEEESNNESIWGLGFLLTSPYFKNSSQLKKWEKLLDHLKIQWEGESKKPAHWKKSKS